MRITKIFGVMGLWCALCFATASLAATTSNPDASNKARAILAYLKALSDDRLPGVIMGQNVGHGDQIVTDAHMMSKARVWQPIINQSGVTPGIMGIDYEHDQIFSLAQLQAGNGALIDHANAGGLITINWSPLSPWLNNETNIAGNPGSWLDNRTGPETRDGAVTPKGQEKGKNVNLDALITPGTPSFTIWRRKLDRIASALQQLQAAGVVVLWRPMQEMNAGHFWWGTNSHPNDSGPYKRVFQDMHQYFTNVKHLNNLLWVYSPVPSDQGTQPAEWAYPGTEYVDIIAPTTYNDDITLTVYAPLRQLGKPMGMAELGPASWMNQAKTGTFDTRKYARLLTNYPGFAYWVSWHGWSEDGTDTPNIHMALGQNPHLLELTQTPGILNLSTLKWKLFDTLADQFGCTP